MADSSDSSDRSVSSDSRDSPDRTFLTTLTGSFSTPADGNPTVVMIEAAYRHHALAARYVNCDVDSADLGDAITGARAMGWVGFNCSLPHKVAVIDHLSSLTEAAELIGAVNCVRIDGSELIGHNTDGAGFVESLRTVRDPAGARVAVLGAGGAARAIGVECALAGAAEVTIVNRNERRGRDLAVVIERAGAASRFVPWTKTYAAEPGLDVLVQATSVGLGDERACPAVDLGSLRPGLVVADVIPNPPRTALLRAAEDAGCTTLDGLGMLVNQGAVAIRLWTGVDPDRGLMREALAAVLR